MVLGAIGGAVTALLASARIGLIERVLLDVASLVLALPRFAGAAGLAYSKTLAGLTHVYNRIKRALTLALARWMAQ